MSVIFILYAVFKVANYVWYTKKLKVQFKHRVHINGIRGKSSVTRLTAGAMNAKYKTLAKTTGTAARIIWSNTKEEPIKRKEASISEQYDIISSNFKSDYDSLVFECMAVNPVYQAYLEKRVMQSTISVITNVRLDHQDQMGKTLPEIAKSLANTVPKNAILITAETEPELVEIMRATCARKNTNFIVVSADDVSDKDMSGFKYVEFKENVAVALKVAELLDIKKRAALKGMYLATPDPGVLKIQEFKVAGRKVIFFDLFAVNDKESFVFVFEKVVKGYYKTHPKFKTVSLMNNRKDRPERIELFASLVIEHKMADCLVALGANERAVEKCVDETGAGQFKFLSMGDHSRFSDWSGEELLTHIVEEMDSNIILLGTTNIHTKQAEHILEFIETALEK